MHRNLFPAPAANGRFVHRRQSVVRHDAFTLIELLVVMAIIGVLLALIVPAMTSINSGRQTTLAAYNIGGMLDTARAYAKANNTYTWVGFYEEDGSRASTSPATAGSGRIIASAVASANGTAMYPANTDQKPLTPNNLVQLGKLLKIDNAHLDVLAQTDVPSRTVVTNSSYQVASNDFNSHVPLAGGSSSPNLVTFTYPISATQPAYTFVKIIQFSPLGDATKIVDSPTQLMELGFRPTRGSAIDTNSKNLVALQVSGIGGAVRVYQP